MRTVQLTLDDDLIIQVDRISKEIHTNRSAFTREALREAILKFKRERLEQKHRRGYERRPVTESEFSAWDDEQNWGDE
ncbi:ribbon-helix-helix protein, CopG family [Candidatus Sumerlaeota bacterium]|nr:ribbon-helix-helix protein, CopG family [Candidatus Sumerlaeota bacterium]